MLNTIKLRDFIDLVTDAGRRDLSINAMAMDMQGRLIDPFNGRGDIENKILKHVNLDDDPVRVLRLARFHARFGPEWLVSPKTKEFAGSMKDQMRHLTMERVRKEYEKAMCEKYPWLFFCTLLEVGVLDVVFPEVAALKNAKESLKWHPEGDTFEHTMLVMEQMAGRVDVDDDDRVLMMTAALVHDFGKALTPVDVMPKHPGHEVAGLPVVKTFMERMGYSTQMVKECQLLTRYHMHMHLLGDMKPVKVVRMLNNLKVKHSLTTVQRLVTLGQSDQRGRLGFGDADVTQVGMLMDVARLVAVVPFDPPKNANDVQPAKDRHERDCVKAVASTQEYKAMKAYGKEVTQ